MNESESSADGVVRAFMAVELPPAVRAALTGFIERLRRSGGAHVRWTLPENLHITLAFLGDIGADAVRRAARLLDEASASEDSFDLECAGVGAFGSPRAPRIIWAGVEDAGNRLGRLQACLAERLKAGGFLLEDRPFHAHVTLGRVRSPRGVRDLTSMLGSDKKTRFGGFRVERLVLMRSHLEPGGARYILLHASPLKGVEDQ
jgi:2'-5' RNA ligase